MYPPLSQKTVTSHLKCSKPLLRPGYQGPEVTELQKLLAHWNIPVERQGNHFNPALEQAVKTFQRRMFLKDDGIVSAQTWEVLYRGAPINMSVVKQGSFGRTVTLLQEALQAEGDYPGLIDGKFGPLTDRAVRTFQKRQGLVADGVVGSCTWRVLSRVCR